MVLVTLSARMGAEPIQPDILFSNTKLQQAHIFVRLNIDTCKQGTRLTIVICRLNFFARPQWKYSDSS